MTDRIIMRKKLKNTKSFEKAHIYSYFLQLDR